MTESWLPIRYRGFYDVPLAFFVEAGKNLLFFYCAFDDALDEYRDEYMVYRVKHDLRERIELVPWDEVRRQSVYIGVVPTSSITFDTTKRQSIKAQVLELLDLEASEP